MKIGQAAAASVILGLVILTLGCRFMERNGHNGMNGAIAVAVLYAGEQCGAIQQGFQAVWLDRPDQLRQMAGHYGAAALWDKVQWDPDTEGALWIRMGVRPSGGYGLELLDPMAPVRHGVATVSVRWRKPDPDRFVIQVLTSPCLLLKLPKAGIEKVHIQDQDGSLRARVNVSNTP
jgi:hypothetical protein